MAIRHLSAEMNIYLESEILAEQIYEALLPEINEEIKHTRAKCMPDGKLLKMVIEAEDIAGLRAAINSYLRWIDCEIRILEGV